MPDVSEIVPYAGITIRAHTGNECAAEFIKKAKNRNIQRAPHLGRNIYYHRDGIFWGSYHHITVTIFFLHEKKNGMTGRLLHPRRFLDCNDCSYYLLRG